MKTDQKKMQMNQISFIVRKGFLYKKNKISFVKDLCTILPQTLDLFLNLYVKSAVLMCSKLKFGVAKS